MSAVLIIVFGLLFSKDGKTDGTRIRCFEIARALKRKRHKVVIAQTVPIKKKRIDNIEVISINKVNLKETVKNFDVVITYPHDFIFTLSKELKNIPVVIDIYDPVLINNLLLKKSANKPSDNLLPFLKALSVGDLFLCANEKQRLYYLGLLNLLGKADPGLTKLVKVPFGTPRHKLSATKKIIKGKIVPHDKKVILWIGEMYPWFDPLTVLKAMNKIVQKRDDVVLVFVGPKHFQKSEDASEQAKIIRKEASEMGLLNKKVFFMPWVPYKECGSVYLESDLAVITYKSSIENELCYRTRIIDLFWGEVPVICTQGDVLSELIKERNLGFVVKEGDVDDLAKKIMELLKSPKKIKEIKKNIKKIKKELSWDKTIMPLHEFCKKPVLSKKKELPLLSELPETMQKRVEEMTIINEEKLKKLTEKNDRRVRMLQGIIKEIREDKVKEIRKVVEEKNKQIQQTHKQKNKEIKRQKTLNQKKKQELTKLKKEFENTQKELTWKKEALESIYNSRLYKHLCKPIWDVHNKIIKKEKNKKKRKAK